MPRIGELLLEHGWVDATNLRRALAEQSLAGGKRICSLLVARGLLDPDNAARALGQQHDVPAALQKHLEHRDRTLVSKLPGAIARTHFALPIGRTRSGELIVCVRDPSELVQATIRRAIDETVVIAVAPASQLEYLIEQSYDDAGDEFDVDLSTGTQLEPAMSSMPELGAFQLADLDDVRVNKDHNVSQVDYKLPKRTTLPPINAVPPPYSVIDPATVPPGRPIRPELEPEAVEREIEAVERANAPQPVRASMIHKPSITTSPPTRPGAKMMIPPIGERLGSGAPVRTPTNPMPFIRLSIDEVVDAIDDAVNRDTATDVAMRYAGQRWTASLLLAVKEGAALGHRGHGTQLTGDTVRAIAVPLTTPSLVKAAHDTKKIVTETPPGAGAIHERIVRLLGRPHHPIAGPIMVAGRIACVFAVGDSSGPDGDSARDLERLTTALGDAYTRILRDMK